jgi:hypothetical protein
MSLLYLTSGTLWIFLWAKAQEHSHKIHIVIGAVAVAGLHEFVDFNMFTNLREYKEDSMFELYLFIDQTILFC